MTILSRDLQLVRPNDFYRCVPLGDTVIMSIYVGIWIKPPEKEEGRPPG